MTVMQVEEPPRRVSAGATRPTGPVRVMHVLFRLQAGGMEYGVIKLVNGLDRSQVSSSVCSTTPADEVKALLRADVPLHECRRRSGNDPSLVLQLYRLFRRERPHIVHTHAWGTLCEGVLAARLARVPVVIHGEHGTLQLRPYQAHVQRVMWGRAERVLSVSSRLAERMASATGFPLNRITVIRNGVDLQRFQAVDRPAARRALGLPADGLVVGTAGRLVPVKDHATLVQALKLLRDRGVAVTGVVAGDGPLRAALEAQARALGIAAHVMFPGHLADVERLFAALDVFVLSSRSEGLSNTILEAMASGLPVVATRVGGADELVEDGVTGILVPPENPGALADGILRPVGDPQWRRAAGAAGQRRALSTFGLSRMLDDYSGLYGRFRNTAPGTSRGASYA